MLNFLDVNSKEFHINTPVTVKEVMPIIQKLNLFLIRSGYSLVSKNDCELSFSKEEWFDREAVPYNEDVEIIGYLIPNKRITDYIVLELQGRKAKDEN